MEPPMFGPVYSSASRYDDDDDNGSSGEELAVGSVVRDPTSQRVYELEQFLGNGSYARVFLARVISGAQSTSEDQHAKVAIKCLSKRALSEHQLQLQREEVAMHRAVGKHANVVELFHAFETDAWLFLVMEYCGPLDMYAWIMDHAAHGVDATNFGVMRDVFRQMLDAMAVCHAHGVYHRDLKPENFLVAGGADGKKPVVKLTDFGLATTEKECDDFECGSSPYISFECRNASDALATYLPAGSDTWALGVIFLNLFYCRSPWDEADRSNDAFAAFVEDSEGYLRDQFGCSPAVAKFLVTRVFCDEASRCDVGEWQQFCRALTVGDVNGSVTKKRSAKSSMLTALDRRVLSRSCYLTTTVPENMATPPLSPFGADEPFELPKKPAAIDIMPETPRGGYQQQYDNMFASSMNMPELSWSDELDDDSSMPWEIPLPSSFDVSLNANMRVGVVVQPAAEATKKAAAATAGHQHGHGGLLHVVRADRCYSPFAYGGA
jgi:serine/threonine protein kinase